jgi:hypothetical protein
MAKENNSFLSTCGALENQNIHITRIELVTYCVLSNRHNQLDHQSGDFVINIAKPSLPSFRNGETCYAVPTVRANKQEGSQRADPTQGATNMHAVGMIVS